MLNSRASFFLGPNSPVSMSSAYNWVLNEPYETVPRMLASACSSGDFMLIDPPKLVGPKSEAWPGLRSKSVELIHWRGKLAQEWCVGLLVSSKGMPSNVSVYWPSANPRKKDLPCPSPMPFGLMLKAPGAC